MTNPSVSLHGELSLSIHGQSLGGKNRIELLAAIGREGSISKAAKAVGLSYKGAWDAVDTMNNLAGEPLVEKLTGGKGGGGTRLTEKGELLVSQYQQIAAAQSAFLQQLESAANGLSTQFGLMQRLNLRTSARNQFFGVVETVRPGAVNDEITLRLPGNQTLVAIVTSESTHMLALQAGSTVIALIKSSSILLANEMPGVKLSARNQLTGTIERIAIGAVNSEITLTLSGGLTLAAIITEESREAMGLVEGQTATALFKASSVILGVIG